MASVLKKTDTRKDDEDEDIEALRLAALMTLRKKPVIQPASSTSVTFKPHFGNPNLIAIIPEGAEPTPHKRQHFFRHHTQQHQIRGPPHQPYRSLTSGSHTTLKVLPQVATPSVSEKKENDEKQEREEVSTKFSRFEDTESESEDESEKEEKESNESSDESEDVLALQDEDDSLEALMAQMEHEIEAGIDVEPNKKEKKKSKNVKLKEKEQKCKSGEKFSPKLEKTKVETKTAVVEPTVKDKDVAVATEKPKSTVKIHPIKISNPSINMNTELQNKSPQSQRPVDTTIRISSQSPSNKKSDTPTKSPPREVTSGIRIFPKSRSRTRSRSPRRTNSPVRRKSPRMLTPDRRSPVKRSPDRFYPGKRSPSPYYKSREREYSNRSRSPIRRKSLSPRRATREPSPKYYQRRSRSPWSPVYRRASESPRYRSPVRRRSLSPRNRNTRQGYQNHSPVYRGSPKRRTPSVSPRRSLSPLRKREYSPQRRRSPAKRDYTYRRNSLSPRRKQSPPSKKYSPQRSPRRIPRSPSPRKNSSPRRRISPLPVKESRSKADIRSRSPSLSLSPSPPREPKGLPRRYKSPIRPRREVVDTSNRSSRTRRPLSPDKSVSGDGKEKRKLAIKSWERDNRPWERKTDDRRKDRGDKIDIKKERETNRSDKEKQDDQKDEGNLKITDNPVFEARRKKFESTTLVEPASKKIRLVSKKSSPIDEKPSSGRPKSPVEEKKNVEHSVQTEDDLFSGQEEVDEIDNFLNEDQEDVLDLSAEVWDSDEDLIPKVKKPVSKKSANNKGKSTKKHSSVHSKRSSKEKRENFKVSVPEPQSPPQKRVAQNKSPSPEQKTKAKQEQEQEGRSDRDESDLRAELSRRREERLTKAGSLHDKLPRRLLQDAFESALGKKKVKREEKPQKSRKETKKKDKSPPLKEKSDGRRVLVLKRQAPVKMQSAHINVTFPSRDAESESETSYTSSSSSEEEERYAAAAPKRKLPVYMRLGTATTTTQHKQMGRKVKLGSRRSQVGVRLHAYYIRSYVNSLSLCVRITVDYKISSVNILLKFQL